MHNFVLSSFLYLWFYFAKDYGTLLFCQGCTSPRIQVLFVTVQALKYLLICSPQILLFQIHILLFLPCSPVHHSCSFLPFLTKSNLSQAYRLHHIRRLLFFSVFCYAGKISSFIIIVSFISL